MNIIQAIIEKAQSITGTERRWIREDQGVSGTEIYGGFITNEDHNVEWQDDNIAKNVDEMIRVDPLVRASLMSYKLPILAGSFDIVPASDQPIDIEIADFVKENLFSSHFSWHKALRETLTYLDYGHCVMAKRYEICPDGKWRLASFGYRKQATIEGFFPDVDGDLGHIKQLASDWGQNGGDVTEFKIQRPNIFLITNDQLGQNYQGRSILRSAYRSYKIKNLLIKIDAAKHEKWGIGIPRGKNKKSGDDGGQLKSILRGMTGHEKGYIHYSEKDYEIDILERKGDTSTIESVKYHDTEINKNLLRDFMSLGTDGVGSLALSSNTKESFYDAISAVGKHIADEWSDGSEKMSHIKQLVDLNFANIDQYPRMVSRPKTISKLEENLDKIPDLVNSGAISADLELENQLRGTFDMEEIEEKVVPVAPDREKVVVAPSDANATGMLLIKNNTGKAWRKGEAVQIHARHVSAEFLTMESRAMDITNIAEGLNAGHERLRKSADEIFEEMENELVKEARAAFRAASDIGEIGRAHV